MYREAMSGIFERNVPGSTEVLRKACVGIAGCGGLGSNAALALARGGVGRLILVDPDMVELSNLNRQQFFREDVGRAKVEALAERLRSINPELRVASYRQRLTPEDIARIFMDAQILIEAFDRAEDKAWLLRTWCGHFPDRPVVCASGVSGLGRTETLHVRRSGQIVVCGDEWSDPSQGLCAPRVAIVANMQANVALELLIQRGGHNAHRQ